MSWNAPQNWAEVTRSVEAGFTFSARGPLRVQGDTAHAVCGHYSTRSALFGHLDDFAHRIIESNDDLHDRYMGGMDRWAAQRPDDVTYFVCRDGNALAYVTRIGQVVVNEQVAQSAARYRNAMTKLMPALERYAYTRRSRAMLGVGDEVRIPATGQFGQIERIYSSRAVLHCSVHINGEPEYAVHAFPHTAVQKIIDF